MEELQAFQFRVGHRARVHYNNADNLHRRPFATAGRRYCEWRETHEQELREEEEVNKPLIRPGGKRSDELVRKSKYGGMKVEDRLLNL